MEDVASNSAPGTGVGESEPSRVGLNPSFEGGDAGLRVVHLVFEAQRLVNETVDLTEFTRGSTVEGVDIGIDVHCGKEDIRPTLKGGKAKGGRFAVDVRRLKELNDAAVVRDLLSRVALVLAHYVDKYGCRPEVLRPLHPADPIDPGTHVDEEPEPEDGAIITVPLEERWPNGAGGEDKVATLEDALEAAGISVMGHESGAGECLVFLKHPLDPDGTAAVQALAAAHGLTAVVENE